MKKSEKEEKWSIVSNSESDVFLKVITFHSYKGGTGKSFLSLNVAAHLASQGQRVVLVDFDTRAPTLYHRFQPDINKIHWLNDYFETRQPFSKILVDYSHLIENKGRFYIVFSSPKPRDMQEMQIKTRQWQQRALTLLMKAIVDIREEFDWMILDSSPGVTYDSLNAMSSSHAVILVSTPDHADILGTTEMSLDIWPSLMKFGAKPSLVLNKVPRKELNSSELIDTDEIIKNLKENIDISCIARIPIFCDSSVLTKDIFVTKYPSHPLTSHVELLARVLVTIGSDLV